MDISHTSWVVELEARKSHKHYNPFNQNTWVVLQPKCFDKNNTILQHSESKGG